MIPGTSFGDETDYREIPTDPVVLVIKSAGEAKFYDPTNDLDEKIDLELSSGAFSSSHNSSDDSLDELALFEREENLNLLNTHAENNFPEMFNSFNREKIGPKGRECMKKR